MNNVNHRLLVSIVAAPGPDARQPVDRQQQLDRQRRPRRDPRPRRRQMQMVDELKQMNAKLDRLVGVLEGGKLQVTTVSADPKK